MSGDKRADVRERYARTAAEPIARGCGCGSAMSTHSERLGYDSVDLAAIPQEADMGLGCGNPTALGELRPGQTVVDLGSGGGIDCFLAARKVGPEGKVIGVDMTREMIDRARTASSKNGYQNVEFRLGEIESLPIADGVADVIISNCVINLSPFKERVFKEAFRVLKHGGRLMVSDIVLGGELPEAVRSSAALWASCVSGAVLEADYQRFIREAGFSDLRVVSRKTAAALVGPEQLTDLRAQLPSLTQSAAEQISSLIESVQLVAVKP